MLSLREAVSAMGMPEQFSLRAHLRSWPPSLAELIRIAGLPPPDLRDMRFKKIHGHEADDAQGVVNGGGETWFLASKDHVKRFRIAGPDPADPEIITETASVNIAGLREGTDIAAEELDHIGDLGFGHNLLFVPVRNVTKTGHVLFATNIDFTVIGYARLADDTGDSWCAVNPWNGLLYLPHSADHTHWLAFDVSSFVERLADQASWGNALTIERNGERDFHLSTLDGKDPTLDGTQGIAFSTTGTVYVTRTDFGFLPGGAPFTNFIHVFSSLTGRRFSDGITGVLGDDSVIGGTIAGIREIDFGGIGDEIEGLTFHPSGTIYLAVAEHDPLGDDDYELYAVNGSADRPL